MDRNIARATLALVSSFALALGACKGDQGPAGPAGPPGTGLTSDGGGTTDGGNGSDGGVINKALGAPAARLFAKITSVTIPNAGTTGGIPQLTYRLFNDAAMTEGTACAGSGSADAGTAYAPNFTIARLIDDPQNTGTKRWQSYLERQSADPIATGGQATIAAAEGAHNSFPGTLKDNGDGSCTYTFLADLSKKVALGATAGVTQAYDPAAITRFGIQNNPTEPSATDPAFDGYADVLASTGAIQTADPRQLVADAACNACHSQIAHHGAKRLSIGYCVTCHNAGTADPDPTSSGSPPSSLDLAVLIHKIHQGSKLPSVSGTQLNGTAIAAPVASAGCPTATGATTPTPCVIINGTDYTAVGFPQDTSNCMVCHSLTTGTGSDYWKTQASIEACTACHDRTSFAATAPAGFTAHPFPAADGSCVSCHAAGSALPSADVTKVHSLLTPTAAQQKATLKILSVTNTAPGQKPVVKFSVTNPASANANMDVLTDPLWKSGTGGRLGIDIGWVVPQATTPPANQGEDWNNSGSLALTGFGSSVPAGSAAPGQPVSMDVIAGLGGATPTVVKNSDGTYTASLTVAVPSGAMGSGVAVLEGHPGAPGIEYPVRTDTMFFAVTDAKATPRRQVVDIQKCDKCHGMLSLHGANRNDNIDACVVCHNTEATDITQRNGPTPYPDNKPEQSIDFATMVHSIHAGGPPGNPYAPGITVFTYTGKAPGVAPTPPGSNASTYNDVMLPEGNSVGRCFICHNDANPVPSASDVKLVNGVAQLTVDSADQTAYMRTTPVAAVCSSCHGSAIAIAHMKTQSSGNIFSATQSDIDKGIVVETCNVCHGKGASADSAMFHGH